MSNDLPSDNCDFKAARPKTAIVWELRPYPWSEIGPRFKADVERILQHPNPFCPPLKVGPLPPPRPRGTPWRVNAYPNRETR